MEKRDDLGTQLACAADLVNSWARELGIRECENPYQNLALREAIDRIWSNVSGKMQDGASIERAARDLPDGYFINIQVENGAGNATLFHESELSSGPVDESISDCINRLVDEATQHAKEKA